MTDIAQDAVANSISFEAKKDSCKQLQGGQWTLTLKIHPDDVNKALMLAAPGQRYMCALAAIGDDEKPLKPEQTPTTNAPAGKPRTIGNTAAWHCTQPEFQEWVCDFMVRTYGTEYKAVSEESAINALYLHFNITSRSELNKREYEWDKFIDRYRAATQGQAEIRS